VRGPRTVGGGDSFSLHGPVCLVLKIRQRWTCRSK
jgi:hypothetical protein